MNSQICHGRWMQKAPKKRYLYPFLGSLIGPGGMVGDQTFGAQDWWVTLPWLAISAICLAFIAGELWADFRNGNSWIATRVRDWFRIFDFESVKSLTKPDNQCTEIRAKLKFKKLRNISAIQLRILNSQYPSTINVLRNKEYAKDATENLLIARIPDNGGLGTWGDTDTPETKDYIPPNAISLVIIDVQVKRFLFPRQQYKIYLQMNDSRFNTGPRFHLTHEAEKPSFDEEAYVTR